MARRFRVFVGAPLLVLGALEIGQHLVEGPTGIAELAPMIVVLGLPANVEQSVDGAGATQHFAPRPVDAAIFEPGIGLGLVAPVQTRIVHGLEVTDRNVNPRIPVPAACFDEKHRGGGIGGEAVCQYTSRRAGTNNDVVVFLLRVGHRTNQPDSRVCGSALAMPGQSCPHIARNPNTHPLSAPECSTRASSPSSPPSF